MSIAEIEYCDLDIETLSNEISKLGKLININILEKINRRRNEFKKMRL